MNSLSTADLLRKKQVAEKQLEFIQNFRERGGELTLVEDRGQLRRIQEVIGLLAPLCVNGREKARFGGDKDGGYVMLPPDPGDIAYSFGVSESSPWDLEMARLGVQVFQYDASIEQAPDEHPNIKFHKYFLAGLEREGPYKTVEEILRDHNHASRNDIILQMDIEGAEWEVLPLLSPEQLNCFKQIIVEFHHIDKQEYACPIFRKLRQTHTPIHFHYNNNAASCFYLPRQGFIYNAEALELTYVRNDALTFSTCRDYFPTELDCKNTGRYDYDMPIGFFDLLLAEDWE